MRKPASLGGTPAFPNLIPVAEPTLPRAEELVPQIAETVRSRNLTNGPRVRQFEHEIAERLSVGHAVAVASCTSGLVLTLRALGISGEVILPSFTFFATAHAVSWNGLTPVFADCDADTLNIAPSSVEKLISPRTGAIIGVHIFGNPCDVYELERMANRYSLPLIFDSAHAMGATVDRVPTGRFGMAEVFSLSPTKVAVAGEGGVITTTNPRLTRLLEAGRDYGNTGDYDPDMIGLNARMGELNAILGSGSLRELDRNLDARRKLVEQYREELSRIPGLTFQSIAEGRVSSCKDMPVIVEPALFGMDRDNLRKALRLENVDTRAYFSPPVHRQKLYRTPASSLRAGLPNTDRISSRILCLPLYAHLSPTTVSGICGAIRGIHGHLSRLCEGPERGKFGKPEACVTKAES